MGPGQPTIQPIPDRGNRIISIEGLRGLAMTLVFFGHFEGLFRGYLPAGSISLPVIDMLGVVAHQGVCFFLILSGYFVYRSYLENPGGVGPFALRRVRRMYPPYLTMLGVYVAISVLYPPESKIPPGHEAATWYIAANALMISSRPLITISWTIGTLIAVYTVVPLLWRTIRYERWNRACRIGFILCAAAAWFTLPQQIPMLDSRGAFVLVGFALYEAFTAGAAFHTRGEVPGLVLLACGYVLWSAVDHGWLTAITTYVQPSLARWIFLSPGLFYTCGYVIAGRGRLARGLQGFCLPRLGGIGYSYYLCHGLILKALLIGLRSRWPGEWHSTIVFWAALPIAYACTLVSAWAWFQVVEIRLSGAFGVLPVPLKLRPADGILSAGPSLALETTNLAGLRASLHSHGRIHPV